MRNTSTLEKVAECIRTAKLAHRDNANHTFSIAIEEALTLLRAQPQEWPSGITALFSNDSRYHFVQIGDKKYILSLPEEYEAKEAERIASREYVHYCDHGGLLTEMQQMKARYILARAKVDELEK